MWIIAFGNNLMLNKVWQTYVHFYFFHFNQASKIQTSQLLVDFGTFSIQILVCFVMALFFLVVDNIIQFYDNLSVPIDCHVGIEFQ